MLCVSIHDVAPATWSDCLRLVQAVREVADIPLTWLVVPHYHFRPERSPAMEACLDVVVERGDELALHGYSHLDTEANGGGLRGRFLRNVYTRREGEFAALDEAEARRRIELGMAWFAERGWKPSGFIPPAWLLGPGSWRALRASGFAYTTTFSHFHCLGAGDGEAGARKGRTVLSPSLVYAARNRGGRLLSPRVADATAAMLARAPLVRFSLHPPDARYPELVRHIQRVLERMLVQREAVTKAECARRLMRPQLADGARADAGKIVLPIKPAAPRHAPAVEAVTVPAADTDTDTEVGGLAAAAVPETVAETPGPDRGELEGDIDAAADADVNADVSVGTDADVDADADATRETAARADTTPETGANANPELSTPHVIDADSTAPIAGAALTGTSARTARAAVAETEPVVTPAPDAATHAVQPPSADFRNRDRVVPTLASRPGPGGRATSTDPSRSPSGQRPSRHSRSSADRDRSSVVRSSR